MAEPNEQPKDLAADRIETAAQPESLPQVDAPPLSPAGFAEQPSSQVEAMRQEMLPSWRGRLGASLGRIGAAARHGFSTRTIAMPAFAISRRTRHRAALAAIVAIAAGLGVAAGGFAMRPVTPVAAPAPKVDVTALENVRMLEQTVAKLSKELAAVKGHLDAAARDNRMQLAKLNEKVSQRADDITGSIAKPATVPSAVADKTPPVAPIPVPRPALIQGWTVLEARPGYALIGNRGELFEVRPGVPLPGIGRVEDIRREGDRWIVATAKGLIVQQAERSAAIRPRYYPPYYRPY